MVKSVLFVCNQNSVRSPMAAALMRLSYNEHMHVDSAGVYEGMKDPFLDNILEEVGAACVVEEPKDLSAIDAQLFDIAIALTPEAHTALKDHFPDNKIETWFTTNPSEAQGSRDQIVDAYRTVRDELRRLITDRFPV
ncbi:MAG: low molecular weight phosphatase family protein [Pseudomonadota bacterium]